MIHNNDPTDPSKPSRVRKFQHRRQSCINMNMGELTCVNCRNVDCGVCAHCLGKSKYGGDGNSHQRCVQRFCLQLYPNATPFDHSTTATTTTTTTTSTILSNDTPDTQMKQQESTAVSSTKHTIIAPVAGNSATPLLNKVVPNTYKAKQKRKNHLPILEVPPPLLKKQRVATTISDPSINGRSSSSSCLSEHPLSNTVAPTSTKTDDSIIIVSKYNENKAASTDVPSTATNMATTSTTTAAGHKFPHSEQLKPMDINWIDGKEQNKKETLLEKGIIHHVRQKRTTDRSATTGCFSLTAYLEEEIESQLLDSNNDEDTSSTDDENTNRGTTLYGLRRPPASTPNVCAGCAGRRDDELNNSSTDGDDHPVLLCDGIQCGREYHLACCIPPLLTVPEGNDEPWYCYDCSEDGTAGLLRQYLDKNDKERVDYYSNTLHKKGNVSYVEYLRQALHSKSNIKKQRNEFYECPESELVVGAMIHSLALCDCSKLARTRGGNEHRESLSPEEYIGKPIRLYDRRHKLYHTGRIVAFRNTVTLSAWGDYQLPNVSSMLTSPPKDDTPSIEYYIRFPAGKDNRKSTIHHWITLEEHSLSIGTTLVWARIAPSQWIPSILWLSTSLALATTNSPDQSKIDSDMDITKTKHKVCAMVRTFGDECFTVINIRDQCVDLFDSDATDFHLNSHPHQTLLFSLARTEAAEQSRVRDWYKLKQVDPIGPTALSGRDYWSLPELGIPLDTECNDGDSTKDKALMLPNVRRGIDRSKVIQMLYRRGYNVTKDIAATMSCTTASFDSRTIDALCLNADPKQRNRNRK